MIASVSSLACTWGTDLKNLHYPYSYLFHIQFKCLIFVLNASQ